MIYAVNYNLRDGIVLAMPRNDCALYLSLNGDSYAYNMFYRQKILGGFQ